MVADIKAQALAGKSYYAFEYFQFLYKNIIKFPKMKGPK